MELTSETRVKDIALTSPSARQVLEDAGLDYCCGGGKSLHEACLRANISSEEILNRLREKAKANGTVDFDWMVAPLWELTRHIREQHHRYVRESLRSTQPLAEKVATRHGWNHTELLEIRRLFTEVGREMVAHMEKEEQMLFPYIDRLEQSVSAHNPVEPPFFRTLRNPIHVMMQEHDVAGELVAQIRTITADYTVPQDACASFRALYAALHEFEGDLHLHVHLENNILFPRAVEMETAAVPA